MKSLRFLYSTKLSRCCRQRALLVRSRAGGLVSQNCLKCGKPEYADESALPELMCDMCESQLTVEKLDKKNYFYVCARCNRNWLLANSLPHWSELFQYSGLAAGGDYPPARKP